MAVRPAKVLKGEITALDPVETWDYDDGSGDPWIGLPYRYSMTMLVTPQMQSSHQHGATPFFYTANDAAVGDFIFSTGGSKMLKVASIVDNSDAGVLQAIVEDEDRLNLFNSDQQSGDSSIFIGECFLFEAPDGRPALYPLPPLFPGTIPEHALAEIATFFSSLKRDVLVPVFQENHGFTVGTPLQLGSDGVYYAASNTYENARVCGIVERVLDTATGPHKFYYRPIGPVVTTPMPTGPYGDLVFIGSTPGELTMEEPFENAIPAFIKLDDGRGILISNVVPIPRVNDTSITAGMGVGGHKVVTNGGLLADSRTLAHAEQVLGISVNAAGLGGVLRVRTAGEITEPTWNWALGTGLFLGQNGALTQVAPNATPSAFVLRVARVIAPTRVVVAIQQPTILAM